MKGSIVNLKPTAVPHVPGLGFDGLVGYIPSAMAKNANCKFNASFLSGIPFAGILFALP